MQDIYIKLTLNEIKNLRLFLDRVDLKGSEAGAFVEILLKINSPYKDLPKEEESKELLQQEGGV